jgi:hypothetical protein
MSTAEAEAIWDDSIGVGEALPDVDFREPSELAISANGLWFVRKIRRETLQDQDMKRKLLSAAELANAALSELKTLKQLGVDVISHAYAPASDEWHVFTITPYLPTIAKCPPITYEQELSKPLAEYYGELSEGFVPNLEKKQATRPYLWDLTKYNQYSVFGDSVKPFLHDVEPQMSDNPYYAHQYHDRVATITLNAV